MQTATIPIVYPFLTRPNFRKTDLSKQVESLSIGRKMSIEEARYLADHVVVPYNFDNEFIRG